MEEKTFLIFGISKGLGKALAKYLPNDRDATIGISRTKPDYLDNFPNVKWISADLSDPIKATEIIKEAIKDKKIDYFIYNVGIWESNGFTKNYSFADNTQNEILNLINTNISSCVLTIQALIENLRKSANAKIILIGSTWGLDNHNGKEVTFSATKFALRGIVHSLRQTLKEHSIGISILNLGTLATEYEMEEGAQIVLDKHKGYSIPLYDVMQAMKFIISTTNASCIKEIDMPAMKDNSA